MSTRDAPTQVRIRTDPDKGLGHRYDQILRAKKTLGKSNNTDAVVAACEHAVRDVRGKERAMDLLADEVGDELLQEVADALSTPQVEISLGRSIEIK